MLADDVQQRLDSALYLIGEKESRISRLETENATFRAQIDALLENKTNRECILTDDQPRPGSVQSGPGSDLATATTAKYDNLIRKYNELAKRYRDLDHTYQRCQVYINDITKKFVAAKECAKRWKDWYDRCKIKTEQQKQQQQQVGNESPQHEGSGDSTTAQIDPAQKLSTTKCYRGTLPQQRPASKEGTAEAGPTPELIPNRDVKHTSPNQFTSYQTEVQKCSPTQASVQTLRAMSSQITEPEAESEITKSSSPRQAVSSDSEPVFVSARSTKRRRSAYTEATPPPAHIKLEPLSSRKVIGLMSDDYSSPLKRLENLTRRETSDLDASVDLLNTPRKRKGASTARDRTVSERPPVVTGGMSSLSDGDAQDPFDERVRFEKEVCAGARQLEAPLHECGSGSLRLPHRDERDALQPISVNVPAKRRSVVLEPTVKRRRRNSDTLAKIAALSEDGDNIHHPGTATALRTGLPDYDTPEVVVGVRLERILDHPSPDRLPLVRSHEPGLRAMGTLKPSLSGPLSPSSTSVQSLGISAERKVTRPPRVEVSPPPVQRDDEPLSLRPLSALRLDDFRINPRYMRTDFAFSDTLKGRDRRRCLNGCTRSDCCGDVIRKIVEMGGVRRSTKSDAEAFEAYLGPSWREMIGGYPPEKRHDLLQQSHAHWFAHQFGKHRQALCERQRTPPGFWRADMPTSQEEQEDRAKAIEMEKAKVEERWREALRENGRWLFRDE